MSLPSPGGASDPERQFVANLPVIERILSIIARRHALPATEADEFGAWAKARLIDGDYAVFRKFAGRSAIATYLTTVLTNLFRDYRNSRWGRWRPSAMAKRLGPIAVRLEELLHRDGYPLREAIELLRAAGCGLTDAELARTAAKLPPRTGTEVSLEAIGEAAASEGGVVNPPAEPNDARAMVRRVLHQVVEELPPEEALLLRMRFWSSLTVADIARALRIDQKVLYRRLEVIMAKLRAALEARGVDRGLVSDALDDMFPW